MATFEIRLDAKKARDETGAMAWAEAKIARAKARGEGRATKDELERMKERLER